MDNDDDAEYLSTEFDIDGEGHAFFGPEHDDVDDTVGGAHRDRCRARAKQKSP